MCSLNSMHDTVIQYGLKFNYTKKNGKDNYMKMVLLVILYILKLWTFFLGQGEHEWPLVTLSDSVQSSLQFILIYFWLFTLLFSCLCSSQSIKLQLVTVKHTHYLLKLEITQFPKLISHSSTDQKIILEISFSYFHWPT